MQTRSGFFYPKPELDASAVKGKRRREELGLKHCGGFRRKKIRQVAAPVAGVDFFDGLPDDLVLCVLCKLSSSARCPSDLVNILMTCKRFNGLGVNPMVLAKASAKSLAVRAKNWSEQAHRFLKRCADSGNLEACYILGMIKFYCLQKRCSVCGLVNYCSRACQALHWKYEHKNECRPMDRWLEDPAHVDAQPGGDAGGDVN
ncbi:F-box protein At1g67340-like [Asparagus officinalis]|nr:F-box protein At1g67340-like [Asparagus officinalis]